MMSQAISIDKIDDLYRRVLAVNATLEKIGDDSRAVFNTFEDWENPFFERDLSIDPDSVMDLIEKFVVRKYCEAFKTNSDAARREIGDYEEWFTPANFSVVAFVERVHNGLHDKIDEVALAGHVKNARAILPYHFVEYEPPTNPLCGYVGNHNDKSKVDSSSIWKIRELWWLAEFLNQPKIGADPPNAFRAEQWWIPQEMRIPYHEEFGHGPFRRIDIYKNRSIRFHFKNAELFQDTVAVLQGEKPRMAYRKQEIDLNVIFKKEESKLGKRIVRMEVAA